MSLIYKGLLDNSIQAAISSIEIYNKPDFKYREQVFTILNINAWELLLKGKILKDANDNLESLYICLPDGKYKTTRSGNYLTIDINKAMKQLALDQAIIDNLGLLIEIRDTAVHFYETDYATLAYLVYTLGVASLKNYQTLINQWFERSLLEYNFFIMPLAFAYNFQTLSTLVVENNSDCVSKIIKAASATQESLNQSSNFYFICEVATEIKSAKKLLEKPNFITAIDNNSDSLIVLQEQNPIDKYPLSYLEVWQRVKKAKPTIKQGEMNGILKKIKGNTKYSHYHFRSKKLQEEYKKTNKLPNSITIIYNEDAVRYVIENFKG
ncbi:DUF3644 domain-containing protein [Nostoc sp. CHAB 5844]|nr:DUF3644 domain-containing protein [Nostoc sp. CHAB 5844]